MADQKISALPAATTPLAGTEVLPIVQSSTTVKVSVDNLTAGKNVKAASVSVGTSSTAAKITVNGDVQAQGAFGTLSGSLGVAIGAASGAISGNDMAVIAADAYNNYKDLIIAPRNNGADVGNTILKSGNFVIGTAGKGIDFSATSDSSGMTSELLADYEEGTWTPALDNNGTITFTERYGRYIKIGKQVHIWWYIKVNTVSGGAGVATLAAPFAASVPANGVYGFVGTNGLNTTNKPTYNSPAFYTSNTSIYFQDIDGGDAMYGSDITAGCLLAGSMTYFV